MTTFTQADYDTLAALVFRPDYPGNATARGVVEAPNGDPAALDSGKRYSHVAEKYLRQYSRDVPGASGRVAQLGHFLERTEEIAWNIALQLGVPEEFLPSFEHSALRVLEYPAGVGGHLHTDFDLFAVNLWRSCPNTGLGGAPYHMGEIGELVGLGPAEPHHVEPLPVPQQSLVYFAIPDHAAVLPRNKCRHWDGADATVGQWLQERIAKSRYSI